MEARSAAEILEVTLQKMIPQKINTHISTCTCKSQSDTRGRKKDDHISYFHKIKQEEARKSQALCDECMGFDKCPQSVPGLFKRYISYAGQDIIENVFCQKRIEADRRAEIAKMFKLSGIPDKFRGDSWDDYRETQENSKALNAAKWVAANDTKGVLFYGSVGSGKTKLAAIIANEKMKAGCTVIFSSVPDLLQDIKSTFNPNNDKTTGDVLKALQDTQCLVLDDMGVERVNEWVAETLFTLINHRENNKHQTIITSNYSPKQLAARLSGVNSRGVVVNEIIGQRIMSRLKSMCHFIELNGPDYRLQESGRKAWQA